MVQSTGKGGVTLLSISIMGSMAYLCLNSNLCVFHEILWYND